MKMLIAVCGVALIASQAMCAEQIEGPNVKRSNPGYCYERGSPGYKDTLSYKAFDSLQACVDGGGRLPNKTGWGLLGKKSESSPTKTENNAASNPTSKKLFDARDSSIVKQTREGVCLEASQPQYQTTNDFAAYKNLKDCLEDGGRAP
jgi:hypothetical protein